MSCASPRQPTPATVVVKNVRTKSRTCSQMRCLPSTRSKTRCVAFRSSACCSMCCSKTSDIDLKFQLTDLRTLIGAGPRRTIMIHNFDSAFSIRSDLPLPPKTAGIRGKYWSISRRYNSEESIIIVPEHRYRERCGYCDRSFHLCDLMKVRTKTHC